MSRPRSGLMAGKIRRPSLPVVSPLTLAVHCLLLGGMACATGWAPSAAAQEVVAAARQYDIPGGPLSQVLTRFSTESGIYLIGAGTLVQGRQSPGLHGRYSVDDGFAGLLRGSGLVAARQADGSYGLRLAPPGQEVAMLAPTQVMASQDREGLTEGTHSYTTASVSTGTRLNLSPRETPQSVSVMTRQQIDDQSVQSVEDVALRVTGLTLARGAPERAQLRSRGFGINTIMADGVPMALNSDMTGLTTLAMYDHVEVLRGAAGLMQGTGNPSATINLIRKRPTDEAQIQLTGSVGRWDNYRAELDAGGPLNEAGTLRGRTVMAWQDTDSFRDHYDNRRRLLYGILEADLTQDTTLTVGGSYNHEANNGSAWYGVPTYADGSFLPISRSANFTPSWAFWDKRNLGVFADLEHRWHNGWKAKLSAQASNADMTALYNNMARVAGSEDIRFSFVADSDYAERMRGVDLHATGPFSLLGREHELVVGASFRNQFLQSTGDSAPGYDFVFDPTQPWLVQNAPYPTLGPAWGDQRDRSKQYGSYVTARLNLADPLKFILGGRLDWYDAESTYNGSGSSYSVDRQFTPYAGLVFDVNDTYSLYASWTRIFQPQSNRARDGALLAPVTGTNYEAGVKGEYFGGALNASVAAFKVVQANLARALPNNECAPGVPSCSEAAGEVESKGGEFELAGQLTSNWHVMVGYTFALAKYKQATSSAAAGARFATDQPRHLFKLFTSYRLPGELNTWRVGGGLRMQSEIYRDTGNVRIRQGGYALVDLMLAWQATANLGFRLNVNNVFDRYYYESVGTPTNGNGFGSPRNVQLTAQYRF